MDEVKTFTSGEYLDQAAEDRAEAIKSIRFRGESILELNAHQLRVLVLLMGDMMNGQKRQYANDADVLNSPKTGRKH